MTKRQGCLPHCLITCFECSWMNFLPNVGHQVKCWIMILCYYMLYWLFTGIKHKWFSSSLHTLLMIKLGTNYHFTVHFYNSAHLIATIFVKLCWLCPIVVTKMIFWRATKWFNTYNLICPLLAGSVGFWIQCNWESLSIWPATDQSQSFAQNRIINGTSQRISQLGPWP